MRYSSIAAAVVAAFGLSACSTFNTWTSFWKTSDDSQASSPAPSSPDESAELGRVVEIASVPGTVAPIEVVDIRMDNGDLRTVLKELSGDARVGDRVRVVLAESRAYRY